MVLGASSSVSRIPHHQTPPKLTPYQPSCVSSSDPRRRNTEMASTAKDDKSRSVKRVAVVGAGVSGLAAAYKLKSHGLDVTVFEAQERAGGKLRSVSQDGLIWDEGANTMTESEMEAKALINDLALEEKQQFPISQHKRYIVRNGRPLLVPTNPVALLTSKLLSSQSKFQVIFEPFMWKKNDPANVHGEHAEESVGSFFQRHFGKEVVDYLIDPFVAGTSAGDPESLSMHYSFPELWNLEKRFGSLIAGALQSKLFVKKEKTGGTKGALGNKKPKRGSFSFYGGMQTLTNTLSKELGKDNLKLNTEVLSLSYCHGGSSSSDKWSITCSSNQDTHVVDAVIMTAPLSNFKDMKITNRGNPFSLDFLPEVTYMPLSVIITTFKKENVKRPLEGFGVLVPSNEQQHGLKTLGTLFSSMMFPDRAPSNLYLYTTFIGGSRNRELAHASTDELKQVVTSDLRKLLGAEGEPTFVNHFYWSKAFPLYGHNYGSVLEAIDKLEKDLPGFFYAGNHKGGLSVGKAITSGCKAADLVISYLNSASEDGVPSD
ncbi:protoporphyrinogen oxidase, mitochondrial-like isoform X1 [Neltuma alba]|uniref:protoporphyrinogen oxidase, mitochondrial-like isoform X1 n=2 Tax=Neltuma alba TaxID=207710 RepID=UPI0010A39769|nr:protoporphyrinogen oxidase, mitochondrial-like isoform X1 [Prosopis alba]